MMNYPTEGILSGESGSVVVDSKTNKVYGHVVGSGSRGHAYVVPMVHVLQQLRDHFPAVGHELANPDALRASAGKGKAVPDPRGTTAPEGFVAPSKARAPRWLGWEPPLRLRDFSLITLEEPDDGTHSHLDGDETQDSLRSARLDSQGMSFCFTGLGGR